MDFEIGENVAFEEDGIVKTGEIIGFVDGGNSVEIQSDLEYHVVDIDDIWYW
jgi:hypothetical protein